MLIGSVIVESLRPDVTIEHLPLVVRRIIRGRPASATPDQPAVWTNIEFEVDEAHADALAAALAGALDRPGWWADFRSDTEMFVVFAERIFRYPRGDAQARERARAYGRAAGVPEAQLDWTI